MPLRKARPVSFQPRSLSDSVDATNQQPGCLLAAKDLVPSMHTQHLWVPRPAAMKSFDFTQLPGSSPPFAGEALVEIGERVYGFVASNRFPGHSEPFCYDFSIGAFRPVSGLSADNTPAATPPAGDWTPPTIARVGGWVLFSSPGFQLPHAFGWLDQTSLADSATGDTGFNAPIEAGVWGIDLWDEFNWSGPVSGVSNIIGNLAKNVLNAGWRPGQMISDSAGAIPPGTTITAIARNGLAISLSQAATAAVQGDTLTVKGGTPSAPLWAAGNISLNPLAGVANSVQIFNGRAWYAVKNASAFSDAGDPLVAANANQVVTLQNGLDITAQATIPFNNSTVAGGIVNALLLFQGDSGIWQVTGDQAAQNLALDFLSPLGTLAPLSLASAPLGLFFAAPDGLRLIQLDGTVSEPLSANGDGVALPLINARFPSRICAAINEDVLRISTSGETTIGGSPVPDMASAEFWFHMKLKAWSGPHSFPAKLITASDRPHTNHGFLMFPLGGVAGGSGALQAGSGGVLGVGGGGVLAATAAGVATGLPEVWFSNTRPLIDSSYVENGNQMNWRYATTLLPDTLQMFQNMMVETSIVLGLNLPGSYNITNDTIWDAFTWDVDNWDGSPGTIVPNPGQTATVNAYNEAGVLLASAQVNGFVPFANGTQLPAFPPSFWDTLVWDQSTWNTDPGGAIPAQRRVPWPNPVVFKQVIVEVTSQSSPRTAIGNLYLRYQQLGYLIEDFSTLAALGRPGAPPVSGATAP